MTEISPNAKVGQNGRAAPIDPQGMGATGVDAKKAARVTVIDAVRAIALFGVLVMNFRDISGLTLLGPYERVGIQAPVDRLVEAFLGILVDWKSLSAFSLLFGISFTLILESCRRRGIPTVPFYLRRLFFLLCFGVINIAAFFWGDILVTYAILGLVLLPASALSQRSVLALAAGLIIGTPLILALFGQAQGVLSIPVSDIRSLLGFSQPTFLGMISANIDRYLNAAGASTGVGIWRYLTITGLFLLGLWVGRAGIAGNVAAHRGLLRRIAMIALPVGLVLATLEYMVSQMSPWSMALLVGTPILAIGYVAAGALFLDSARGVQLRRLMAPAGQMALTLYLLGGLFGEAIFYGWGFGLLASVGDLAVLAIAFAVFAALVAASHVWMSRFRYGPFEWIWRCLTHMSFKPA